MSSIVSRFLLALGFVSTVPIVFALSIFLFMEMLSVREQVGILLVCGLSGAWLVAGWILIWFKQIIWSQNRILWTVGSLPLAGLVGLAVYAEFRFTMGGNDYGIGTLMGCMAWGVVWLGITAIIWRENHSERGMRLFALGISTAGCTGCGFNLSGIPGAFCPECGVKRI